MARLREISSDPSNDPNNPDNDPEPYYDPTQPLTYGQAKDLIRVWELWEREQVANAWEIMKSRKSNKSSFPTHAELIAALAELSPREPKAVQVDIGAQSS